MKIFLIYFVTKFFYYLRIEFGKLEFFEDLLMAEKELELLVYTFLLDIAE